MANRINLLYEDDSCFIFDKPAGLAVQGGQGVNTSLDSILEKEFPVRPLLVHRLDKDTSGVILTAKSPQCAAYYTHAIAQKEAEKKYYALCYAENQDVFSDIKNEGEFFTTINIKGTEKEARTFYKICAKANNFVLFELVLATGRMHQIRRQLAQKGFPVLGDDKYGAFKLNKLLRKKNNLKRLLLHASQLTIKNPAGTIINVCAPLPDYFKNFAEQEKINLRGDHSPPQ
ncbi:MAG: hypothetical protein Ta2F_08570 [Termitinemataceae bacterium]|nr:MAG: hypothetical protein Ta2F_08570 [Termitinemataceae bacterium]